MRYVSEKYEKQLADLAETLMVNKRLGEVATQPEAEVVAFPHNLQLKTPPEHGWDLPPAA